jgi:hypothetical protein
MQYTPTSSRMVLEDIDLDQGQTSQRPLTMHHASAPTDWSPLLHPDPWMWMWSWSCTIGGICHITYVEELGRMYRSSWHECLGVGLTREYLARPVSLVSMVRRRRTWQRATINEVNAGGDVGLNTWWACMFGQNWLIMLHIHLLWDFQYYVAYCGSSKQRN